MKKTLIVLTLFFGCGGGSDPIEPGPLDDSVATIVDGFEQCGGVASSCFPEQVTTAGGASAGCESALAGLATCVAEDACMSGEPFTECAAEKQAVDDACGVMIEILHHPDVAGKKGFMEECSGNEECETGLCSAYDQGQMLCSKSCQADCECGGTSRGCNMKGICKRP